jgi:hypothetical protein
MFINLNLPLKPLFVSRKPTQLENNIVINMTRLLSFEGRRLSGNSHIAEPHCSLLTANREDLFRWNSLNFRIPLRAMSPDDAAYNVLSLRAAASSALAVLTFSASVIHNGRLFRDLRVCP